MDPNETKTTSAKANEQMKARTPGCLAFEAYCAHTGGSTYDGKKIPPWSGLPEQVKGAWEAAAAAVTSTKSEETEA